MKLSREKLKTLVKEELEQEGFFGDVADKIKSSVGMGMEPAHRNQGVRNSLAEVDRILNHLDIFDDTSVNGDRFGLLASDAHVKLADFVKKNGLTKFVNIFANLYGPLEKLRQSVISSKDESAIDRFTKNKEGIHTRLWPLSVYFKTNGEQILNNFQNLNQLNSAIHKGQLQIPQDAGLLSLIVSQAGMTESKKLTHDKLKQIVKEELQQILSEEELEENENPFKISDPQESYDDLYGELQSLANRFSNELQQKNIAAPSTTVNEMQKFLPVLQKYINELNSQQPQQAPPSAAAPQKTAPVQERKKR